MTHTIFIDPDHDTYRFGTKRYKTQSECLKALRFVYGEDVQFAFRIG